MANFNLLYQLPACEKRPAKARKRGWWLTAVLCASMASFPSQAKEWYAAVTAGGMAAHQVVRSFVGATVVKSDFDRGVAVSGAVGMREGRLRFEGEIMRSGATVKKVKNWAANTGGHGGVLSTNFMANLYFDFSGLTASVTPYVGVGVGFSQVKFSNVGVRGTPLADDTDRVLSFQAKTGIAYRLSERTDLLLQYRLFGTQTPQMHTLNDVEFESDGLLNHHLEAGLRVRF